VLKEKQSLVFQKQPVVFTWPCWFSYKAMRATRFEWWNSICKILKKHF